MREYIKFKLCRRLVEAGCPKESDAWFDENHNIFFFKPDQHDVLTIIPAYSFQAAFAFLPDSFGIMHAHLKPEYLKPEYWCFDECSGIDSECGCTPIEALEAMIEKLLDYGYRFSDGQLRREFPKESINNEK